MLAHFLHHFLPRLRLRRYFLPLPLRPPLPLKNFPPLLLLHMHERRYDLFRLPLRHPLHNPILLQSMMRPVHPPLL